MTLSGKTNTPTHSHLHVRTFSLAPPSRGNVLDPLYVAVNRTRERHTHGASRPHPTTFLGGDFKVPTPRWFPLTVDAAQFRVTASTHEASFQSINDTSAHSAFRSVRHTSVSPTAAGTDLSTTLDVKGVNLGLHRLLSDTAKPSPPPSLRLT